MKRNGVACRAVSASTRRGWTIAAGAIAVGLTTFSVLEAGTGGCVEPKVSTTTQTEPVPRTKPCANYTNCPDRIMCEKGRYYDHVTETVFKSVDCLTYTGGHEDENGFCYGGELVSPPPTQISIFIQHCGGNCN